VHPYFLTSAAAVAVAAAIVLSLFSLPKPTVAPQCSDCDFVLEGTHSLIIANGKAYLVRGAVLTPSAVLAEYAWAYTPQGPRNITCPERIWVSVRQGIAFADCQPFVPSSPWSYTGHTNFNVPPAPKYLKITVRYYHGFPYDCRNHVFIYVGSNRYATCSSSNPAIATVYFDLDNNRFLTADPSSVPSCSSVAVTSVDRYIVTTGQCNVHGCSSVFYLNINGLSFRGDGWIAEYGMTIRTDIGRTVTVSVFDGWIADWGQGADVLELSICG